MPAGVRALFATVAAPAVSIGLERGGIAKAPAENLVDLRQIVVPIVLFVCITYAFKAVLDAVMRYRMLREPGTEDLLRSILQGEQAQRRLASLRWGLLLIALAAGLATIQIIGWQEINPGGIAILAGSTGIAHLVFYALSRRQT